MAWLAMLCACWKNGRSMGKRVARLLFLAYSFWMLWLLFGQRIGDWSGGPYAVFTEQNLNLVPLATIRRYSNVLRYSADFGLRKQAVVNLAGNVCLFVPLGVFLPWIWPKLRSFRRMLLCASGVILAVEGIQFLSFLGCCDVDDFILNMVGIFMGFVLWKLAAPILDSRRKSP